MKLKQKKAGSITPVEDMFRCGQCGNQMEVAKTLRILIERMDSLRRREIQVITRKYERMIQHREHASGFSGDKS